MAPPPQKQIVVSNKEINGPIHAVPCPWCGKPNDFRGVSEAIGATFEAGNKVSCDTCKHYIIVTKVVQVTVVANRQSKDVSLAPDDDNPAAVPAPAPQQPRSTNPLAALLKPRPR